MLLLPMIMGVESLKGRRMLRGNHPVKKEVCDNARELELLEEAIQRAIDAPSIRNDWLTGKDKVSMLKTSLVLVQEGNVVGALDQARFVCNLRYVIPSDNNKLMSEHDTMDLKFACDSILRDFDRFHAIRAYNMAINRALATKSQTEKNEALDIAQQISSDLKHSNIRGDRLCELTALADDTFTMQASSSLALSDSARQVRADDAYSMLLFSEIAKYKHQERIDKQTHNGDDINDCYQLAVKERSIVGVLHALYQDSHCNDIGSELLDESPMLKSLVLFANADIIRAEDKQLIDWVVNLLQHNDYQTALLLAQKHQAVEMSLLSSRKLSNFPERLDDLIKILSSDDSKIESIPGQKDKPVITKILSELRNKDSVPVARTTAVVDSKPSKPELPVMKSSGFGSSQDKQAAKDNKKMKRQEEVQSLYESHQPVLDKLFGKYFKKSAKKITDNFAMQSAKDFLQSRSNGALAPDAVPDAVAETLAEPIAEPVAEPVQPARDVSLESVTDNLVRSAVTDNLRSAAESLPQKEAETRRIEQGKEKPLSKEEIDLLRVLDDNKEFFKVAKKNLKQKRSELDSQHTDDILKQLEELKQRFGIKINQAVQAAPAHADQ